MIVKDSCHRAHARTAIFLVQGLRVDTADNFASSLQMLRGFEHQSDNPSSLKLNLKEQPQNPRFVLHM